MRKPKLTPELRHSAYLAFQNIRHRCTNRNNKDLDDYGGRGIECVLCSTLAHGSRFYWLNGLAITCDPKRRQVRWVHRLAGSVAVGVVLLSAVQREIIPAGFLCSIGNR